MKERFVTTLEEETKKELKKMAIDEGIPVNELIPEMMKVYNWYKKFYERHLKDL